MDPRVTCHVGEFHTWIPYGGGIWWNIVGEKREPSWFGKNVRWKVGDGKKIQLWHIDVTTKSWPLKMRGCF